VDALTRVTATREPAVTFSVVMPVCQTAEVIVVEDGSGLSPSLADRLVRGAPGWPHP
jgi:hypothetical protein